MARNLAAAMAAAALAAILGLGQAVAESPDHLRIELRTGNVLIRLRPDLAPNHVARIVELASAGFYDGVVFHRVIDGFMAQTGDPTGTGRGGSGKRLASEFTSEPFRRGTVGMARAQHPDSADSQFFICFADAPFLNGQYTVFGEVVEGMVHIDTIKRGVASNNGMVLDPDAMIHVRPVSSGAEQ